MFLIELVPVAKLSFGHANGRTQCRKNTAASVLNWWQNVARHARAHPHQVPRRSYVSDEISPHTRSVLPLPPAAHPVFFDRNPHPFRTAGLVSSSTGALVEESSRESAENIEEFLCSSSSSAGNVLHQSCASERQPTRPFEQPSAIRCANSSKDVKRR